MAKVLDSSFETRVFGFHLCYYVHSRTNTLREGMNPIITGGLNSIIAVLLQGWLWH